MVVSILMEFRFDKSGGVRARGIEVLPFQIYTAGDSVDEVVYARAALVFGFSIIRILVCGYSFLAIYLKVRYRDVLGIYKASLSVLKDSA